MYVCMYLFIYVFMYLFCFDCVYVMYIPIYIHPVLFLAQISTKALGLSVVIT